ncbi:hypothetical protein ACHAXR_013022 [Thalassiosira sp. AJA248-18]
MASLIITLLLVLGASASFAFQLSTRTKVANRAKSTRQYKSPFFQPTTASTIMSKAKSSTLQKASHTILSMGAARSPPTKDEFQNKSIVITGASRGLGKSLALQLAACNPSLLILSARDKDALQVVKRECSAIASQSSNYDSTAATIVEIVVCDLSDKSSVDDLASTSLKLAQQTDNGVIDVLINNGGISSRSSFLETKLDVDEMLMQVNFFSGLALAKALIPGMIENEEGNGRIIWISSVQGKLGTPYRTSYAASKFAVQGFCEALRSEMASSNVSVHIVSPGYIRTNLSMSAVMGDGGNYGMMDKTTANGADPDEVAANILDCVTAGKTDFVVAATPSARVGIWLKFLAPSILDNMLSLHQSIWPHLSVSKLIFVCSKNSGIVLISPGPLQLGIESRTRTAKHSTSIFPEFGQSHPPGPILMSYIILPRCVNIPTMRPRSKRQRNLLSHEAPRQIRVEGNINQKLGPGEEKSSGNVRYLRRRLFLPSTLISGINPQYFVFYITIRERALSCRGGAIALCLVHVQCADLSTVAILGVVWITAKFFNPIDVGGTIADLCNWPALLVLSLDLHAGAALDVYPETILDDGANEQLVRIFGIFERLAEGFPQQMIAVCAQGHEDGFILANGKNGSIAVR